MNDAFYVPESNKPFNSFRKELDELKKVNQLKWSTDSYQTIQLLINLLEKSTDHITKIEYDLNILKNKNR